MIKFVLRTIYKDAELARHRLNRDLSPTGGGKHDLFEQLSKPSQGSDHAPRRAEGSCRGAGGGAALGLAPGFVRYIQVSAAEPIKIGFQAHRTGIGAAYGRWYERTTNAAVKLINDARRHRRAADRADHRG